MQRPAANRALFACSLTTRTLTAALRFGRLAGRLEPGRNGLGFRPAPAGTSTSTLLPALAVAAGLGGLGATVGAVGEAALGLFLFLTDRRFATRLHDRIRDRLRDQLHRANRIVVAGDRDADEVRVRVGVDDGHDRQRELVRLV